MRILTADIYEGAYLLSQGMRLERLLLNGNNTRKTIVFEFTGDEIDLFRSKYKEGIATVDVSKLKKSLTELKDLMFNLLRAKSGAEIPIVASGRRRENEYQYAGQQ